jgi:hypothetical protein
MKLLAAALLMVLATVAGAGEPGLPSGLHAAAEPVLPAGLESSAGPGLPEGLEQGSAPALPEGLDGSVDEPLLPAGLGAREQSPAQPAGHHVESLAQLSGFVEARGGLRLDDDPLQQDASIGELRLQGSVEAQLAGFDARLTTDLIHDGVDERSHIDLEQGSGWLDLREASLVRRIGSGADLKLGRQILTWGTGDLLFINDLFPKDWNAFFIGRDDEYLKAPSDALRLSLFHDSLNLEVVYTPRFDADRYIDGRRISWFNPATGASQGREQSLRVERPDQWLGDDEIAVRAYRTLAAWELAAYGYNGYWKSPGGFDALSGRAIFPALAVAGASARGPVLGGIGSVETGYYHSRDDGAGDDPFINNSEWRVLAGLEREIAPELTLGLQYYLEHMQDHGAYRRTLAPQMQPRDRDRQLLTLRLTRLLMNQNLTLSLFAYASPSDQDAYLRPLMRYKWSDQLQLEAGANLFRGANAHSFFGQFEDASNLYLSARFSF